MPPSPTLGRFNPVAVEAVRANAARATPTPRSLNPVAVEAVRTEAGLTPGQVRVLVDAQASEVERRRAADRERRFNGSYVEENELARLKERVFTVGATPQRGEFIPLSQGPGVIAAFGTNLPNANLQDLVSRKGVELGEKAYRKINPSGQIAASDADQLVRMAQETADIVSRAPGALDGGGPPAGVSNIGATNIGRSLAVPLGAMLAAGVNGAGMEVRGGIVDAATIARSAVNDVTAPLVQSLDRASAAVTSVGGAVRQVGADAVTVSANIANGARDTASTLGSAITTASGQLAASLDAGALGTGLGTGIRDGLTNVGQSVERVAAASGGVPITVNINSAELNRTVLTGMVGATIAIAGGIGLGMMIGRAAQRLMAPKNG